MSSLNSTEFIDNKQIKISSISSEFKELKYRICGYDDAKVIDYMNIENFIKASGIFTKFPLFCPIDNVLKVDFETEIYISSCIGDKCKS